MNYYFRDNKMNSIREINMKKSIEITNYLKAEISGIKVKIFLMKVKDVLNIYYVSRRGESTEEGYIEFLKKNKVIY